VRLNHQGQQIAVNRGPGLVQVNRADADTVSPVHVGHAQGLLHGRVQKNPLTRVGEVSLGQVIQIGVDLIEVAGPELLGVTSGRRGAAAEDADGHQPEFRSGKR
jgi:hypothetical protein